MIAYAQVVLLSVDSNLVALLTTDILSQKPFVGPIIGIPIILSLYRKASFISIPICSAKNSKPKVDASTVACFLIYHMMGVRLIDSSNLVCDLQFILLPACAASQRSRKFLSNLPLYSMSQDVASLRRKLYEHVRCHV